MLNITSHQALYFSQHKYFQQTQVVYQGDFAGCICVFGASGLGCSLMPGCFPAGVIPDETKALSLLAPANAVAGLLPGGGLLPTPNPLSQVGWGTLGCLLLDVFIPIPTVLYPPWWIGAALMWIGARQWRVVQWNILISLFLYFLVPRGPVCASHPSHPLYFTDVPSSRDLTDFKFLESKELPCCEIPFINPPAEGKIGAWLCEPTGIHVEDEQWELHIVGEVGVTAQLLTEHRMKVQEAN